MSKWQEVFIHAPPVKSESMFCRLNLRSPDLTGTSGGSRGAALSAGQIAAAFAFAQIWVPEINRYQPNHRRTEEACFDLAMYKHVGSGKSYERLCHYTLQLAVSIAIEGKWDKTKPYFYTKLSIIAVHDACFPELIKDVSARRFAQALELDHHNTWLRTWRARYDRLVGLLSLLDNIASQAVERHI